MEKQKLPNSTLILVFGILSIVTCCCYGVVGLILGVIAMFLAKKAKEVYIENPELYTGYQNVKTGKILAIIGVILSLLTIIYLIGIIAYIGMDGLQDPELIQEKMREMMGQ